MFFFLRYSIGSRTDGPNREKKNKRWCLGTNPARQTSLGFLSEEVYFLRDSSIRRSPPQNSGKTLNVYEPPTHTVDQSEQTAIIRQLSQTSWEATHRYQYPCSTLTTSREDQWILRGYHTAAVNIDTIRMNVGFRNDQY